VEEQVRLESRVGFLALHGGLEPGTEGVAGGAAAASGASSYIVTQPRTLGWHVPSHRIQRGESPLLDGFLAHVELVISVHGYFRPEWPDAVYVGGANRTLAAELTSRLRPVLPDLPVIDDLAAIPCAARREPAQPGERQPRWRCAARAAARRAARRQRRAHGCGDSPHRRARGLRDRAV
jgi:Poly-gamma-glutamate hydrolase